MLRSMSPRVLPVPGQRVEVVHLGRREPSLVVRVEGRSVYGEPFWGARLALGHSDVP